MKEKKKYAKPILTKVTLNPAQAILSACSATGTSSAIGSGGSKCKNANCKKQSTTGTSAGSC